MAFFLSTFGRDERPTPPRTTPPLDSLADFEVHAPTLRRRVVQAVGQPLFLVALVLSLLYAALALSHLWTLARPAGLDLARVAAALAAACFVTASMLASWPGLRRATQPLVSFLGLLVLFHTLAQIHLLGEIKYSLTLLPLLIGLACFFVSPVWLTLQTLVTLAAWAATVALSCPQPDWLHYGLTFLVTTLLAALVHVFRVAGSTRIEKMRLRDTERKADLEAVRQALQKERLDRRAADEAQREASARVRLLGETTADLVAQHAANGAYLFASDACREMLGHAPEELFSQTLWDFAHPEDRLGVQEAFLHVRAEGQPQTLEYRLRPAEGPERSVTTTLRPVRDPATAEVIGVTSITRDLGPRQQQQVLETTLQQREDECRRLTASLEDAEADLDRELHERERLETTLHTTEEACRAATERVKLLEAALGDATLTLEQTQADQQALHGAVEAAEHAFVHSETIRRCLYELLPYTLFQLDEHGVYREYRPAGDAPFHFVAVKQPGRANNPTAPYPEPGPCDTWMALVGQPFEKVGTPAWIALLQNARATAQNTGEVSSFTYLAPAADEEPEQHYEVRLFALKNGHCVGIIRNLTTLQTAEQDASDWREQCEQARKELVDLERKASALQAARADLEHKLQQAQAQLQTELQGASLFQKAVLDCVAEVALIAADAQGRIIAYGTGAERLFGYTSKEALGESVTLFHDELELVARGQELAPAKGKSLSAWEALTHGARKTGQEQRTWTIITKEDQKRKVQVRVQALKPTAAAPGGQSPTGFLFTLADLSEKEQLANAVRELEARYEATVQAALEAVITIDADSRVLEFNPAAERLLGMKQAEARQKKITDWLVPPAQREAHQRGIKYYLATGDGTMLGRRVELTALRADGTEFPVEMTLHAEKSEGQSARFTAHLRDLSEQKQLTQAQAEPARIIALTAEIGSYLLGGLPWRDAVQQCAQALVRPFPGAFARLRLLGLPEGVLEVQASAGASPELLLTQAIIGPALLERLTQEKKALTTNDLAAEPWPEKKPDQKYDGVQAFFGAPLLCGDQVLGVLALFSPRPLPTQATDLLGSLTQQLTLGLARQEGASPLPVAAPMPVVDTAAVEEQARVEAALRQEIEAHLGTIRAMEEQLQKLQTELAAPRPRESGQMKLEAERQQFEEKLKAARKNAEAAERARGEFLTTMSQEIRSPLTALLSHTDILLDPHLEPAERLKALKSVKRGSEQLLQVMNDLLDLSRIETGQLQLEMAPCAPWQLVQEVLPSLYPAAQDKGILLAATPSGPIPRHISTDPTRLRQILHHLLRHALHATPRGQVALRLDTVPVTNPVAADADTATGEPGEYHLRLTVEDESGGFTADELDRLFLPMPNFDTAFLRKVGGSGLGLCLARRLARRLGGDLTAESRSGQGNLFTLELPVTAAELADAQTTDELTLTTTLFRPIQLTETKTRLKGRTLLVERSKDNQRVMAYFLERLGLSTEIAPNAETALEWLAEEDFDLILVDMDAASPELDGPQLARLMRDKGYKQPLLALLPHTQKGQEQAAQDAGCDGVLYKPVEQDPWQTTLARYLQAAPTEETPPPSPPSAPTEPPIFSTYREDADFMHLVREYTGSLTGRLAELRAALKVGDLARFIKLGHLLKGSAGTYGYPILSIMAGELENAAYTGLDGPRLSDILATMTATVERIQQAFAEEGAASAR